MGTKEKLALINRIQSNLLEAYNALNPLKAELDADLLKESASPAPEEPN